MRQRSPKTFVKIRSGRKLFLAPNPVMSGKRFSRAGCRDEEDLLVKSDRPRRGKLMSDVNARREAPFFRISLRGAAALSDSIARREAPRCPIPSRGAKRRAFGFHGAARSAALSDSIARREAPRCRIHCAARSAALSDFSARREAPREVTATSHPPPTLYPRPQAGGLLICFHHCPRGLCTDCLHAIAAYAIAAI